MKPGLVPTIDPVFGPTLTSRSATEASAYGDRAWGVTFWDGLPYTFAKIDA